MVLRLAAETVLLVLTGLAGSVWWQLKKRRTYIRQMLTNEPLLREHVKGGLSADLPPMNHALSYAQLISIELRADQSSQRVPNLTASAILFAGFGLSYWLGTPYVLVTLGLFLLLGLMPITPSAKMNAIVAVLSLAALLYRWHRENEAECEAFVAQATSLAPLYRALTG